MTKTPGNLRYAKSHEWAQRLDNGNVRVGITDHAQGQLGDMVFIELPEVGRQVAAGEEIAVVESVKAASDVYSPVSGTVIKTNGTVADAPETVNQAPYSDGWLFEIAPSNPGELDKLLDAHAYAAVAESESH
ncbi:MAG: glycine cleavage system H protein [Gammaproteobacteria bacterium]|nr:MAG: glycine cleavage system H protein [Gammaproteobacteria bacterium]TND04014.1 MAG: glycine cleavage system H protein [Gammaproteobacteria bacterium]